MLRSRKYADKPPEDQLETPLGFLRRQLRHGRLFADDVLQLWDEINDEQSIGFQRFAQCNAPLLQFLFILAE